ncbi:MAG TPA: ParB N-terminal domain-containing protein [Spirochaetota bacterium]|nr:ParB N-terminal domain-containing protein [Spirochaetota bacterium]HPN82552.1 ParB N-terminal domain-containing protein [Spirochaetota bacterium]
MRVERIAISSIKVVDRVRDDYGDIEGLAASLRQGGLVQPIVVDEKFRLIAGGRRLKAASMLGWSQIDACIVTGLTPLQKLDLEVQENLVRKDLTDAEIAKSIEMKKRLMRRPWYVRLWEFFKSLLDWFLSLFKRR